MFPRLDNSWLRQLNAVLTRPALKQLEVFLNTEQLAGKTILPPKENWFNALNNTPFEQVKVVILGQDPYPTPGHAHGLSFSVLPEVNPLPKSLQNINKELLDDLGIDNRHNGYLMPWAKQGVLLLNAVLTVEANKTNAHQKQGWEVFTDEIIQQLNQQREHLVFILWGSYAQKKGAFIDQQKHLVINSPHPSPLSAYRGFFGSKPFSQTNQYLQKHQNQPIDWQLP
jgi:uracil-DNA glycosylase